MAKIKYTEKRFQQKTLDLINTANKIIKDYTARGYSLTLRQLYYQFVARDLFPNDRMYSLNKGTGKWYKDLVNGTKNAEPNYKWIGNTISNARNAGLVDWDAIIDRTRKSDGLTTWNNPSSILSAVSSQYRIDKWKNQDYRIFVWVEKEALAGVIQLACEDENIQVNYLACRGYMSSSTIWKEAQKLKQINFNDGKILEAPTPIIIHLGDHDPSGLDMTQDNINRLELYSNLIEGTDFEFHRIALNWEQIKQYNPPPNFAKETDSRYSTYQAKYGNECFELDALDPDILVELIQDKINSYKDTNKWLEMQKKEQAEKIQLQHLSDNWGMIVEQIG